MSKENKILGFTVIDNETGEEADPCEVAQEEWGFDLMYCDIEGFALLESGSLVLLDECGNYAYCPSDRFTVVFEEERKQGEIVEEIEKILFHREITSDLNFDAYYGAKTAVERIAAKIDELKKKYTDVTDTNVGGKEKGGEG